MKSFRRFAVLLAVAVALAKDLAVTNTGRIADSRHCRGRGRQLAVSP